MASPNSDELVPVYPGHVQGELRQILQTKDLFVIAYKFLEEYNLLLQEQSSLLTKDLVEERLNVLEAELKELKQEEYLTTRKLEFHALRNEHLISHLEALGLCSEQFVASARKLAFLGNSAIRHKAIIRKYRLDDQNFGCQPENPAEEIRNLQEEIVAKIKPILYFYRDLYYLQLHYNLVVVQICSVSLPLVLQHVSLVDRIFFWNERPEFDELRNSTSLLDRLREIYSRTQQVLNILIDCCSFLRDKLRRKKELETKFNEYMTWQENKKNILLRKLHAMKMDIDHLEEENDRMIGLIVKVDPSFVESDEFKEIANLSLTHVFFNHALLGQGRTEAPCTRDEHDVPTVKARFDILRKKKPKVSKNIPDQQEGDSPTNGHQEYSAFYAKDAHENSEHTPTKVDKRKKKPLPRPGGILEDFLQRNLLSGNGGPKRIGGQYLIELSDGEDEGGAADASDNIPRNSNDEVTEPTISRSTPSKSKKSKHKGKSKAVTGDCNISNQNDLYQTKKVKRRRRPRVASSMTEDTCTLINVNPLNSEKQDVSTSTDEVKPDDPAKRYSRPGYNGVMSVLDYDDRPSPAAMALKIHNSGSRWSLLEQSRVANKVTVSPPKTNYSQTDTMNNVQDFSL